jgi:hypothetical protein
VVGEEVHHEPHLWLWLIVVATGLLAFRGLATVKPFREHITPFGSSLIVLFSLIWAVAAVALAIRYSERTSSPGRTKSCSSRFSGGCPDPSPS